MFKSALGLLSFVLTGVIGFSQNAAFTDTIHSNPNFGLYEFKLHIPVGQTFISQCHTAKDGAIIRAAMPSREKMPLLIRDTLRDKLTSTFAWGSAAEGIQSANGSMRGGDPQRSVKGNMTVVDDPNNFLMELNPDPNVPVALNLHLGYGSARLDLSDLDVKSLNIVGGNSDIILAYKKSNRSVMQSMHINGGMSQIIIRNLEFARAEDIDIKNGMGQTKIILGSSMRQKSRMKLEVGAGSCLLLVSENVPVKIKLSSGFFSSVEIPDDFVETGENIYVNMAYKSNPQEAMTVMVDIGIGSFSLITFKESPGGR